MNIHFHCKVRDSRNISPFILRFYLQFDLCIFYSRRGDYFDTYYRLSNIELLEIFRTVPNNRKHSSETYLCWSVSTHHKLRVYYNPIMLSRQSFAKQLPISPTKSTLIINFLYRVFSALVQDVLNMIPQSSLFSFSPLCTQPSLLCRHQCRVCALVPRFKHVMQLSAHLGT